MIADEVIRGVVKANADAFTIIVPTKGVYKNSLAEKLCALPFYENAIMSAQQGGVLREGFLWLEAGIKPALLVVAGERAFDPIVKQTWLDNLVAGVTSMPEGIECIAVPAVYGEGLTMNDYYARLDTLPQHVVMCRRNFWWIEDV